MGFKTKYFVYNEQYVDNVLNLVFLKLLLNATMT